MFLETDDEPGMQASGNVSVATVDQVDAALTGLTDKEIQTLNYMARATCKRYWHLTSANAPDLLQDAFLAVIERRRLWQPANVTFVPFLIGVMQSLASNHHKHTVGSRSVSVTYEHQLPPADAGSSALDSATTASHPSSEATVVQQQGEAQIEAGIAILRAQLAQHPDSLAILDGLLSGKTKKQIRVSLNIDPTTFWSADRRLVRAIEAHARRNEND